MTEDRRPDTPDSRWPRLSWLSAAAIVGVSFFLGFVVLGRYQQGGPNLNTWQAICRAIGLGAEVEPGREFDPPVRTSSRIAWSLETRQRIASGNPQHGAFVALDCGACHGDQGVSHSTLIPTLAGMDRSVIYKQLDDYRSGKRVWGVMGAVAAALSFQDSADVAAYFASLKGGLSPETGEGLPQGGRSLRQADPALRLVFAGDPDRGIPPCAACHGPGAHKIGAPALQGQNASYIERQLGAFAQDTRKNDINEQMRTIAIQLTPEGIHAVADYYAAMSAVRMARN